jgi:hypothetical protein
MPPAIKDDGTKRGAPGERPTAGSAAGGGTLSGSDAGSHIVMFWVLVVMAALVFTPCVLIPVWLETEDLIEAERRAADGVEAMEKHIGEQDRLIEALTSDPLAVERLARRDLRYRKRDEEAVPVDERFAFDVPLPTESEAESFGEGEAPQELPVAVTLARRWLPDLPWVELFGRPPNRTIFLMMAGGLLVAAFVLFGHAEPSEAESDEGADRST